MASMSDTPIVHTDRVWSDVEPMLRDRLMRTIENDPQVLLEVDGGPVGMTADIILATLYGFDEQIDGKWRIPSVTPDLLRPLNHRLTLDTPDGPPSPTFPVARYVLQSSYASLKVSPVSLPLPADVKIVPPDFLATVLVVRYKRKA